MFIAVLLITFVTAVMVAFCVVKLFDKPIADIFRRIIQEEISGAWHRYITFAAYVVGVSGGVRIYELERYISAPHKDQEILILNWERWALEIYRTIIETLQSIAWMYLIVFVVALIAYVIAKGFELRRTASTSDDQQPKP